MTQSLNPAGNEYRLPAGTLLVSKTDPDGVITYANDAFIMASGHAPDALIGQSHRIDRHPDVPGWVFEGMWRRLGDGKPWRGILLNRRANGERYWVDAFIVPIRKQGRTVEYLSVRMEARPEQIEQARREFATVRPPQRNRLSPRRFLSIKRGVLTGVLFVVFSMLVAVGIGLHNLERSADSFYELHAYRNILATVAQTDRDASVAQNQLLVALRHAPQNARVTGEDSIEIPEHMARVRQAQQSMAAGARDLAGQEVVRRYLAGIVEAEETAAETAEAAALLKAYLEAVERYAREGLDPAIRHIEQGEFDAGEEAVVGAAGTLVARMQDQSTALGRYFGASADRHHREMGELIETGTRQLVWWMACAIVIVVVSSIWFFRDTMKPLRRAIKAMRRIAEGDLSERLDIYGYGEPGEVVSTLAVMQVQLKVMLDEIRLAAANVHAQIGKLNQTVVTILNSTEDAHGQASQILLSLENTGADTTRLAAATAEVLQRLQAAANPAELLDLATEAATLAGLNDFAAAEVRRLSQNIMTYLVDSRESVNYAWAAGQNLEQTSNTLTDMFSSFEQTPKS